MRALHPVEVEPAAALAAEAFLSDPLWVFLYPDEEHRRRTARRFFLGLIGNGVDAGSAVAIDTPIAGVALWRAPLAPSSLPSFSTSRSFARLFLTSFPSRAIRVRNVFVAFSAMRRIHAPSEHFYLEMLAVAPSSQGTGVASRLVGPLLDQADAEERAVYTETATAENVPRYRHWGFSVVEERQEPRTGLRLFALLRSPIRVP